MAHRPRKRFGQNFLIDPAVIATIINAIHPHPDDRVVEIGPGLGALTRPLIQILNHLTVIELDRDIIQKLKNEYAENCLTIYASDALKFDFSLLGNQLRIVGNLPYNISTPLLFYLARFSESILDMHFMLQKEVVNRMVAQPSTSDYGRLSVMLQYRFAMERVLIVKPVSFRPVPKVDSAVVRMLPLEKGSPVADDEILFARIVAAAFSQRRKTLRNTLSGYLSHTDFSYLAIEPSLRAENLSVAQYITIADYLAAQKQGE